MSDSIADRFNQFYRDFYAGRIEFGDYRYRRGLILDSLVDKPAPDEDELETLPRDAKEPGPPPPDEPARKPAESKPGRPYGLPAVLAVSAILVIAVIYFVVQQISRQETDLSAMAPQVEEETVPDLAAQIQEEQEVDESPAAPPEPGQVLVEEFVVRQDWRRMSVAEFQASWGRLSVADRIVAKGAVWFQPLVDLLRDQIDEAQAIALDPGDDPQLDMLYELSLRLGIVALVPPGWTPKMAIPEPELAAMDKADDVSSIQSQSIIEETVAPEPQESVAAAGESASDPVVTDEKPAPKSRHECSADQLKTRRRNGYDAVAGGESGPLLKVLAAGEYVMGDGSELSPQKNVTIDAPFAISIFEVTQAQYGLFCEQTGAACDAPRWKSSEMPVVNVNRHEASAYCKWLSESTGQKYRLPTDAEWEYATRAGTTSIYPFGDKLLPAQARYSSINQYDYPLPTSDDTTQRNKFGLWHVVGNVAEWCHDYYGIYNYEPNVVVLDPLGPEHGIHHVIRGSSWRHGTPTQLRSAFRDYSNDKRDDVGFRICRYPISIR